MANPNDKPGQRGGEKSPAGGNYNPDGQAGESVQGGGYRAPA